jgi:hypothetical protein
MRGRHYGNGIIKIEPSALKRALVYTCKTEISNKIYDGIIQTLVTGDKNKASLEATKLVAKEANIDDYIIGEILSCLNELRKRRGGRNITLRGRFEHLTFQNGSPAAEPK